MLFLIFMTKEEKFGCAAYQDDELSKLMDDAHHLVLSTDGIPIMALRNFAVIATVYYFISVYDNYPKELMKRVLKLNSDDLEILMKNSRLRNLHKKRKVKKIVL